MGKYVYDKYEYKLPDCSFSPYGREYLNDLSEKYGLQGLCVGCQSDYEKILAITKWVSNLWEHDGANQPEKHDPKFILDEVIHQGKRFRCVEYGVVIQGCLCALGITARQLALKTADVETRPAGAGHIAIEAFLRDLDKWMLIDGQWGIIPKLDDVPLNAVEFADALESGERLHLETVKAVVYGTEYLDWIRQYLFFLDYTCWEKDAAGNLTGRTVMLGPAGVEKPQVFQVKWPLSIDKYTHSVNEFYAKPVV